MRFTLPGKIICNLGTFVVLFLGVAPVVAGDSADIIYHNGSILTMNDEQPTVEAVAVKDGKIIAVGAKDEVLKPKGDGSKVVNLSGKTMLPGFIDSHSHFDLTEVVPEIRTVV